MNKASEILVHEHEIILRMLDVVESICDRLRKGEDAEPSDLKNIVEFIRQFADRCHHMKEEDILFQKMLEKGFPREGGPIQVMLSEHNMGREYTAKLEDGILAYEKGVPEARNQIIDKAMGYAFLLREHIHKENNILYPMGDRIFTEDDQKKLFEEFEKVEKEEIGEGVHEKFVKMVEDLEKKYRI